MNSAYLPLELAALVKNLWERLGEAPSAFSRAQPIAVVTSPGSKVGPAGWVGIVSIGAATLVTAPTEEVADSLRLALAGLAVSELTNPDRLSARLPIAETRGPATLAYVSAEQFQPYDDTQVVRLPVDHPDVARFLSSVPAEDASESGLGAITSPAFVLRQDGLVVAAAGYRTWVNLAGHISVLTAPALRGRGLARQVASAATRAILDEGLLPQWRARPLASRQVAQHLGFRELGAQLSLRLIDR